MSAIAVFLATNLFISSFLSLIITKWSINSIPLSSLITNYLVNYDYLKWIGLNTFTIDMCVQEGKQSGINIQIQETKKRNVCENNCDSDATHGNLEKKLAPSQNDWILLALFIDRIVLLSYIIFIVLI